MFETKNKIDLILLIVNIIALIYYSGQLLIFTDEFALNNVGFFNHAVAGLCEILGIIFFSLSVGLLVMIFSGIKKQLPFLITIFFMHFFIALNLWRYVITDSPGETNINIIFMNALIFSLLSFLMLILVIRSRIF
tara:strand:- start:3612 stop:4016 length:405 start_codon:yes stop_codon:yes gene_type:complete